MRRIRPKDASCVAKALISTKAPSVAGGITLPPATFPSVHRPLSELVRIEPGYVFRARVQPDPHGSVTLIQMKDVLEDGRVEARELVRTTPENDTTRYRVETGDVLLVSRGSRFPAGVVMPSADGAVALSLFHILRLRDTNTLLPAYLAWFLNLPETQSYLRVHAAGSGIPFLNRETVGALNIPLPSVEQQQRCVDYDRLARTELDLLQQLHVARRNLLLSRSRQAHL